MNLSERAQVVAGFVPLDLQAQRDGDWVKLFDWDHLTLILYHASGTDGDDVMLRLQQATDNAGAGAKALNFTEIWRKQAADVQTVGQFTKTTQAAANSYTNTDAHQQFIWMLEIDRDKLDLVGGFKYVRGTTDDTGILPNSGCMLYVLTGFRGDPPSAL